MKVNFNKTFSTYNGEDSQQSIKDAVCKGLYAAGDGVSADDKMIAYRLNLKIIPATKEVEITTEEASLIKRLCEKTLVAGAYGQIVDLIEGGH